MLFQSGHLSPKLHLIEDLQGKFYLTHRDRVTTESKIPTVIYNKGKEDYLRSHTRIALYSIAY